jgi:hypothetical protein
VVATISSVNNNVYSSSIATIITCRTHINNLIEDCNCDYSRKQLQKIFLEQGHRLHRPTINSVFWLQSNPACKPDVHVKLEAGPRFVGCSQDFLSDLFPLHTKN